MNICAVIVTYNRLDKLKKCLDAYHDQTRKLDKIIVVDNASSDDTKTYLKEWKSRDDGYEKIVLTLDKNYGGSGGFNRGIKKAMEVGFDWLWIGDDDAYPNKDAFETLENKIKENPELKVICSEVNTKNGIDCQHRRTLVKNIRKYPLEVKSNLDDYKKESFRINVFSFVGSVLKWDVVKKCGLPREDFFIWFDDTEYAFRVNERFDIFCFPQIKVFHDDEQSCSTTTNSWKAYYGERNRLEAYSLHFTRKEFKWYLMRYKLGILKAKIINPFYSKCRKDGLKDFKNKRFGVSAKYKPGTKF